MLYKKESPHLEILIRQDAFGSLQRAHPSYRKELQYPHLLLHEMPLEIEGQTLVLMHFIGAQTTLENDGLTYRGSMRFRLLLEMANS